MSEQLTADEAELLFDSVGFNALDDEEFETLKEHNPDLYNVIIKLARIAKIQLNSY